MVLTADYDYPTNDSVVGFRRIDNSGKLSLNWYAYPQSILFMGLCIVASALAIAYLVQSNRSNQRSRLDLDYRDGECFSFDSDSLSSSNSEMSSAKYDQKLREMSKFFKGRGLPAPSAPNTYARKLFNVLKKSCNPQQLEVTDVSTNVLET